MTEKVAILLGIVFSFGFVAFFVLLCTSNSLKYVQIEYFYILAVVYSVALILWIYGIVNVSKRRNLNHFLWKKKKFNKFCVKKKFKIIFIFEELKEFVGRKNAIFQSFDCLFQQNKSNALLVSLACWAVPLNLWTGAIFFIIFEKMFYHSNFYPYHSRDISIFITTGAY